MAVQYVSKHTGADIDEAVGAYLSGLTAIATIAANNWTGLTPAYSCERQITLSERINNAYPDVFFVSTETADEGRKYYVDYKTNYDDVNHILTVTAYSNVKKAGILVVSGLSGAGNPSSTTA